MNVLPTSRESARRLKANKYYSGKPCKRGHTGMRYARRGYCVTCMQMHNVSTTKRRYKEGYEFLKNLRASTPCLDCGVIYDGRCMEFDHRSGRRAKGDRAPAAGASWGIAQVKKELEKCDLICRNCHNIRTQSRRPHLSLNKNAVYVRNLRATTPCKDCGKLYPWPAMEFDHVRGEKKCSIGRLACKNGFTALFEEIAKCELVCGNCHSIRTFERAQQYGKWKTR